MSIIKNPVSYQTTFSSQLYLHSGRAQLNLNGADKSNVIFFFPDALKLDKKSIEARISVVNAQIPVSFYNINNTNNKINITVLNIITSYYITPGNYNINTFIAQWAIDIGPLWVLTFNSITNKLTFSYTSTFSFSDDTTSLFSKLGFITGYDYISSFNKELIAPYSVDFSGLNRLIISSPTFNLHNIMCSDTGFTKILSVIPITSAQNGIINYTNITNYKSIFKNYELSSIHIQITDDQENYIQFNNVDWSMTLQIDIVMEIYESLETLEDIYINAKKELN